MEQPAGFKPQKPLVYNRLLPYSDDIPSEATAAFAVIKGNLARSVMLREIRPGAVTWMVHLNNYLKLYGYYMSKEDHVHVINLLMELIAIPNLELNVVQKIAQTLTALMKKKELLSRNDLSIAWRPLYELYERALYSPYEHLGMLLLPSNFETSLKTLIRSCRTYFTVASTQEMLDEWTPLLCPFDVTMLKAISYFELFLPTTLPPEEHDRGFRLWLDKFLQLWQNSHSLPLWENNLVWLFARLAQNNIGYVDWDPHIPTIFTRLLRSFNLPTTSGKVHVTRLGNTYDSTAAVNWIAAMLGSKSCCQTYVSSLFKTVESFYHPSNNGRWVTKLQRILYKLPAEVVRRVHRERYRPPSWETPIPASHRLTDDDVTEFVKSVQAVVLLAMFGKGGSMGAAGALQSLALLRPELIVPPVLERLYQSLETVTEPHRLTAALQCVVAVSRSLVIGGPHFPEGPSHVIPLLTSCLPGIDPNDIKKCMVTFQFISVFTTLIPIMDCSNASTMRSDLTELEQEVCLATAGLEDFVLQFMGRCFSLIENSSLENPTRLDRDTEKMNAEENILEMGLASTFSFILTQCSPEIYKSALDKLYSFASSRILETKVSGRYVANLCRSAARVNPAMALNTFVPHFGKLVLTLTESEEVVSEELLDDELLFSLLLLSEMVLCSGEPLLQHLELLCKVLRRTLHLSSRQGYLLAGTLLSHLLRALTLVYPQDFRSTHLTWDQCKDLTTYLPIRDWGRAGDLDHLNVTWHKPSEAETTAARSLLEEFLIPELSELHKWSQGSRTFTREEVQRSLNIVLDCVLGAGFALPMWPGDPLNLTKTSLPMHFNHIAFLGGAQIDLEGNVRETVAHTVRHVLEHTLKTHEDDIKSLLLIIKIYHSLIFFWGAMREDFDTRWKGFQAVKKTLENRLAGHKQHVRALLVDRAQLQHEMRILYRYQMWFTSLHRDLVTDLLKLSTNHYSEVRIQAQEVLGKCIQCYPRAYNFLVDDLVHFLTSSNDITHEQFKGALYVVLGKKQRTFLTAGDWELLNQLWPALVAARHSEKPSIIGLLDNISESLQKYLNTTQILLEVPDSCVKLAGKTWEISEPQPHTPAVKDQEVTDGLVAARTLNERRLELYETLVHSLVGLIEGGSLHWRHYHLGLVMVRLLIQKEVPLPTCAVKMQVRHLIHDTISMRKVAILSVGAVLKQLKRKHVKKDFDPASVDVSSLPLSPTLSHAVERAGGKRPANLWLLYNSARIPDTKERFNQTVFVHKTHLGFSTFPKPFKVYAGESEQPTLDRSVQEMSESEAAIFEAFTSETFLNQMMAYLSLEERKGQDRFDAKRFYLFKGLFRNYGPALLPNFQKVLAARINDNQESNQRCALEVVAGILRGSKHWGFEKMQTLRATLEPLLKSGLNAMMPETLQDWGTCAATVSESRDPSKYHWFLELLMEDPLRGEEGSFLQASRLYVLLGALAQQEWRVCELLYQELEYLLPRLVHSYENVRDKIGSLLCDIFLYDINVPMFAPALSLMPRRGDFIVTALSLLAPLSSPQVESNNGLNSTEQQNSLSSKRREDTLNNYHHSERDGETSPEKKQAARLLRTMSRWILASVTQSPNAAPPELFQIVPVLCQVQSETTDEDLQKECAVTLALLGNILLPSKSIQAALDIIKDVLKSPSWHARAAACNFLQFLVFSNLFTVQSNPAWKQGIVDYTLALLKDERVEVRDVAAESLGGLLHCEFIKVTDELLESFKAQCTRKKGKIRSATPRAPPDPAEVIERHAGILGLCACINAFPYDVPPFMPQVLLLLGDHLNDPQPIPATIKKTLSNFRRTHHDTWRDHKVMFTDDQLAVITDLLVSPSYYA
ncbi:proteasome activator complex subunit 4-like [Ornithodoros turicata]|uniref:proteasome activator complex subunit 4-like n=1 Tax=Ornithodoros turicata TaxID=34597 RepID=UPI0031395FB8